MTISTEVEVRLVLTRLVTYSEKKQEDGSQDLLTVDLSKKLVCASRGGFAYLDPRIWSQEEPGREWGKHSDLIRLAFGTFRYNDEDWRCWLNLFSGNNEWDSRHVHSEDEHVVQLAGVTSYKFFPIEERRLQVLSPADRLIIPADAKHQLDSYNLNSDSLFLTLRRAAAKTRVFTDS